MYLHQGVGNVPHLAIRTNEPNLLGYWVDRFPADDINEVYKLDSVKGASWLSHFRNYISAPNFAHETGNTVCRCAPCRHNRERSDQLFDMWMRSSEDKALFKTVKLSAIKRLSGTMSAAMLIDDVYCLTCEEHEPAFIYLAGGTNGIWSFHPSYARLGEMFDRPLFGYPDECGQLEIAACHVCRPIDSAITENMTSMARRKFSTCKCAPCRGRL